MLHFIVPNLIRKMCPSISVGLDFLRMIFVDDENLLSFDFNEYFLHGTI